MKCAYRKTITCIRDKDGNLLKQTEEFEECLRFDCCEYSYIKSGELKGEVCRRSTRIRGML